MGNEFNQKIDIQPVLDKIDSKGEEIKVNDNSNANDIQNAIETKGNDIITKILIALGAEFEPSDDILEEFVPEFTPPDTPEYYICYFYMPGPGSYYLKFDALCGDGATKFRVRWSDETNAHWSYDGNAVEWTTFAITVTPNTPGKLKVEFYRAEGSGTISIKDVRLCGRLKSTS